MLFPKFSNGQVRIDNYNKISLLTAALDTLLTDKSNTTPYSIRHIYFAIYQGEKDSFLNRDSLIQNSFIELGTQKGSNSVTTYPLTIGLLLDSAGNILSTSGNNLDIYPLASKANKMDRDILNDADLLNGKIVVFFPYVSLNYYFVITNSHTVYYVKLGIDSYKINLLENFPSNEFKEFRIE